MTNSQSWNRYSYVNNSPVMYVDPSGHMEVYGATGGDYEYVPDDTDTAPIESGDQPGDIDRDLENSLVKIPGALLNEPLPKLPGCELDCQFPNYLDAKVIGDLTPEN